MACIQIAVVPGPPSLCRYLILGRDGEWRSGEIGGHNTYLRSTMTDQRVPIGGHNTYLRRTMTDRRGCVHTYDYDAWGRLSADRVTTTGSGVDATVLCIGRTYETLGRLAAVKSYDSSSTSGNVLNQISCPYGDGWGNLTAAGQSAGRAYVSGTQPSTDLEAGTARNRSSGWLYELSLCRWNGGSIASPARSAIVANGVRSVPAACARRRAGRDVDSGIHGRSVKRRRGENGDRPRPTAPGTVPVFKGVPCHRPGASHRGLPGSLSPGDSVRDGQGNSLR